ncbi:MAG: hypothetical protein M3Z20_18360 [Chloroflexota bacterium]|nr:hypothetical protein [Chloroflexota bacterium]
MTQEIADLAAPPLEAEELVDRRSISVLGIRRRYWEMTHGWTAPASSRETSEIDTPGRVA